MPQIFIRRWAAQIAKGGYPQIAQIFADLWRGVAWVLANGDALVFRARLRGMLLLIAVYFAGFAVQASAVEFSTQEFAGQRFTVCRVNVQKERLRLFHRDEKGEPFKRFDRLVAWMKVNDAKDLNLVFAMNAGMFHGDFSAVGLFVSEGKQLVPLNTANAYGNFFLKPNGVFAVTDKGARVVETSEYPKLKETVRLATQSGPMLVIGGKLHPAFNPKSESRLIRNGVGVPSPDEAIFVISEGPVTFYEFATFFRDKLGCKDALFLDGTISSLFAPGLKRSDSKIDLGPMIGVTE